MEITKGSNLKMINLLTLKINSSKLQRINLRLAFISPSSFSFLNITQSRLNLKAMQPPNWFYYTSLVELNAKNKLRKLIVRFSDY